MCGERSHGGVVNGLNLEPEPLHINKWSYFCSQSAYENGPCFSNEINETLRERPMKNDLHEFELNLLKLLSFEVE